MDPTPANEPTSEAFERAIAPAPLTLEQHNDVGAGLERFVAWAVEVAAWYARYNSPRAVASRAAAADWAKERDGRPLSSRSTAVARLPQ